MDPSIQDVQVNNGDRVRKRPLAESSIIENQSPPAKRVASKKATPIEGRSIQNRSATQDSSTTLGHEPPSNAAEASSTSFAQSANIFLPESQHALLQEPPLTSQPNHVGGSTTSDTIIDGIIANGNQASTPYPLSTYDAMGLVQNGTLEYVGASHRLKIQSLPVLDNLVGRSTASKTQ